MSNQASAQEQWQDIAKTLGFPDEPTMWFQLYTREERKIDELAKTLGFGTATISRRLALCGITKRSRGGATTPSKAAAAIHHLDPRWVRLADVKDIAHVIGYSVHRVYRLVKEL